MLHKFQKDTKKRMTKREQLYVTRRKKQVVMDKGSTLALCDILDALDKHLNSNGFKSEWRSVLGQDTSHNPIWSLNIYVELDKKQWGKTVSDTLTKNRR